jgi:hypothetical protein
MDNREMFLKILKQRLESENREVPKEIIEQLEVTNEMTDLSETETEEISE